MTPREPNTTPPGVGNMNMRDMLQALTGGRPYVFVIMGYDSRWPLYRVIKQIAEERLGLACIRADELKTSGHDLLEKIRFLITRADVIVAEISEKSPNVFYEIGYAMGVNRHPLLLIESDREVWTDLRGLEVIRYRQDREGTESFKQQLTEHLQARLNSQLALLRDMLEAPTRQPAYIVASPKYPTESSRIRGQVYDRRTFGDALGVLGLTSAFGSMWGPGEGVEFVSAQHSPPDLLERPLNLYLIGSGKVNPHAESFLRSFQEHRRPKWVFDPWEPYTREDPDWPVRLYRESGGERTEVSGKTVERGPIEVWTEDYGVVIRAPHPRHEGRMVLVLAGAHSLGTGGACLAATRSPLVRRIKAALPEGALEDKESAFWVLVKAVASEEDGLLDAEGVTVEEAGLYAEPAG